MNNHDYTANEYNKFRQSEPEQNFVPDADIISIETVVNILIKKRICTAEELFMLEGRIQEQHRQNKKNSFVSTNLNNDSTRNSGLKRLMGKRRWTRRIATALFGWKWKKVKRSSSM